MISLLITVLRWIVVPSALLLIALGGGVGWFYGAELDQAQGYLGRTGVTPGRLLFAAVGALVGLVLASVSFGVVAILLDIQHNIRDFVRNASVAVSPTDSLADALPAGRVEPTIR